MSIQEQLLTACKGVCMGAADVVPGVSGGTVALVTGIYQRLIQAISHFDIRLVHLIRKRQWQSALEHVDWKFLVALVPGIAAGFVVAVRTLAHLVEDESTRGIVLAAFFGMVVAAVVIVGRMVKLADRGGASTLLPGIAGAAGALVISRLTPGAGDDPLVLWYMFLCGAAGICAMILPGISGALILVLLGVYEPLVLVARELLDFSNLAVNIPVAAVFAAGAATGLALASRLLRWLLASFPRPTLATLCGLMTGSLPLLWPWQVNLHDGPRPVWKPVWPESLDRAGVYAVSAVVAMSTVLVLERWAARLAARKGRKGSQ